MSSTTKSRIRVLFIVFVMSLLNACSFHYYDPTSTVVREKQPIYKVRVKKGDSAQRIAKAFDTSVDKLADLNAEHDLGNLEEGDILYVSPGKKIIDKYGIEVNPSDYFSGKGKPVLVWPAKGYVSSGYGMRHRRFHHGIDIAAYYGSAIVASAPGKVMYQGWKSGYGRVVVLDHQGFKTVYAHCSQILVRKGDEVRAGQQIAKVGRSGNARGTHLHFELRQANNVSTDPIAHLPMDDQMLSWIYRNPDFRFN